MDKSEARDVFISHCSVEKALAKKFAGVLQEVGLGTLVSSDSKVGSGIPAGEEWFDFLENQVKKVSSVVFLITERSLKSQWVVYEFALARAHKRRIYPLLVNVRPEAVTDSPFAQTQNIHFDLEAFEQNTKQIYRDAKNDLPPAVSASLKKGVTEFFQCCPKILETISSQDGVNYNLLEDIDPDNAFRELINELADPNLDRAFAVDSHAPRKWLEMESKIYLIEQAKQNLLNNFRNSDAGNQNLKFIYSDLLYGACQTAKKNAAGAANGGVTKPLLMQHGPPPLIEQVVDNPSTDSEITLEMARILLWKPEDLRGDIGREMIAYHSGYQIPLFYISPKLTDSKFLLDFFLICAIGCEPNNFKGKCWEHGTPKSQPISRLKDIHGISALEVVVELLSHPKLLYASDARQMMESNVYKNFTQSQE